jgi:hypothetical protein
MSFGKSKYFKIAAAIEDRDESRWSCQYNGRTIDVELAEVALDRWAINVSVRVAGWAEDLRFTNREAARLAGEQLGIRFLDDLE